MKRQQLLAQKKIQFYSCKLQYTCTTIDSRFGLDIYSYLVFHKKETRKNEKTTAFSPNKRTVPYPII